jgi:hypothetical protein
MTRLAKNILDSSLLRPLRQWLEDIDRNLRTLRFSPEIGILAVTSNTLPLFIT